MVDASTAWPVRTLLRAVVVKHRKATFVDTVKNIRSKFDVNVNGKK